MSDRLKELQRQRALLLEHLAWLDREMSAAQGTSALPGVAPEIKFPAPIPGQAVASVDATPAKRTAEEIIAQYKQEGQSLQSSVKRGCFLYFFVALTLLGIGVLVLYLFRTRH